jgi:hypothetical protein
MVCNPWYMSIKPTYVDYGVISPSLRCSLPCSNRPPHTTQFSFIEKNLLGRDVKVAVKGGEVTLPGLFLVGGKFSIADSYLYIVLTWPQYVGVDMSGYPLLQAYSAGIAALPQVVAAHALMATNPSST